VLEPTRGLTPEEVCAYGDQQFLKAILRHLDAIILERKDVALNGLTDVADRGLAGLSLRNATRQAGAFRNPEAILARINDRLSHGINLADADLRPRNWRCRPGWGIPESND
jgi:hypothetical protein